MEEVKYREEKIVTEIKSKFITYFVLVLYVSLMLACWKYIMFG